MDAPTPLSIEYIEVVDDPIPVSSEDIEILNSKKIEKEYFKLSKSITDKQWAKYVKWRIGKDSEMSVYINADETIINNKKLGKLGKIVPLSDSESEFVLSVLDDIDRFCGLDFTIVDKPKKADLILSPMKMKKWDYYMLPGGKKTSMNGVVTTVMEYLILKKRIYSPRLLWKK